MSSPSQQTLTPESEAVHKSTKGFQGITCAIDGTTASTLDITVAATAYAVLGDGTLLDATSFNVNPLATTTVTGLTVTGSYTLYLGYKWATGAIVPVFYAALTSVGPTNTAVDIPIASFAVAGSVITTATVVGNGQVSTIHSQVQIISANVVFGTLTTPLGTIPANAVVLDVIVDVITAFNAGTTNPVLIGKVGTLGSVLPSTNILGTATLTHPTGTIGGSIGTAATALVVTYAPTGSAANAGQAQVSVLFYTP